MRVAAVLAVLASLAVAACTGRGSPPEPEPLAGGVRECWFDDDCVIAREVSGCCASCAGVVARDLADAETCLVEDGETTPQACFDMGCGLEPGCGDWCLEPVAALCERGQCVGVVDCGEPGTAPVGTFCRD